MVELPKLKGIFSSKKGSEFDASVLVKICFCRQLVTESLKNHFSLHINRIKIRKLCL